MSWDFCVEKIKKAAKDYNCQAYIWLVNSEIEDLTDDEKNIIEESSGKIRKGESYIHVSGKWEGEFMVFRSRIDLNDICKKYDVYQDS